MWGYHEGHDEGGIDMISSTRGEFVASLAVREWCEGLPVELWINRQGRPVIRALNEDGHNSTEIDLNHLLDWLNVNSGLIDDVRSNTPSPKCNTEPD